jgi:hypothetical protein
MPGRLGQNRDGGTETRSRDLRHAITGYRPFAKPVRPPLVSHSGQANSLANRAHGYCPVPKGASDQPPRSLPCGIHREANHQLVKSACLSPESRWYIVEH